MTWFKRKQPCGHVALTFTDNKVDMVVVEQRDQQPYVRLCLSGQTDTSENRDRYISDHITSHHLSDTYCTTLLNPDDYNVLLTEAPQVEEDELRDAVRWRIKDLIPYAVEEAVLDIYKVPNTGTGNRTSNVYAVTARKSAVQACAQQLKSAGLSLDTIDIHDMAQRNIAALLPQDQDGVMLLALDQHSGLITITRQGEIYLRRALDVGTKALDTSEDSSNMRERVVLEVQRSVDYYDSHFRMAPISDLFIVPISPLPERVLQSIKVNLNLNVALLPLQELFSVAEEVDAEALVNSYWALGAALRFAGATQ
ncbi:MAG: hypothetical protein BMS9Abin36_1574 [Gammaproteobacteria bacterium]|nr:MAG: hypothetical protein BMS9Abin36_1574 [Gammaproteobacteria bacterium]